MRGKRNSFSGFLGTASTSTESHGTIPENARTRRVTENAVAHVMDICAQVLRRPQEQGERIEGWAQLPFDANAITFEAGEREYTKGLTRATLIIHPDPPEPAGGEDE